MACTQPRISGFSTSPKCAAYVLASLLAGISGCGGRPQPPRSASQASEAEGLCPARASAGTRLPGVEAEHLQLAYWLARSRAQGEDPQQPLLRREEIAAYNAARAAKFPERAAQGRIDFSAPIDWERLRPEIEERLDALRQAFEGGEVFEADGSRISRQSIERLHFDESYRLAKPELRISLDHLPLFCAPRAESFYRSDLDRAFDRNRCSTLRPQEPVQILARWPGGMWLVRSQQTLGFVASNAALSPPLSEGQLKLWMAGSGRHAQGELRLSADQRAPSVLVPRATLLWSPKAEPDRVLYASSRGLHLSQRLSGTQVQPIERDLSRADFLEEAFAYLDTPYGWGGMGGGKDCSQFLMEVFESFGLWLPRNSAQQAQAGVEVIEVPAEEDAQARLRRLDEAQRAGIVLLHFPGHIMLYLGRDARGVPMALHSLAEYARPCKSEGATSSSDATQETLVRFGRVGVSTLSLGEGSSRRSFLERLTHLALFHSLETRAETKKDEIPSSTRGGPKQKASAPSLPGELSESPPGAANCSAGEHQVFVAPAYPRQKQALGVVFYGSKEWRAPKVSFVDPSGKRASVNAKRIGGPPFGYWASLPNPERVGAWRAELESEGKVVACRTLDVRGAEARGRIGDLPRLPAWRPKHEDLYALFVEQLFREPEAEDATWRNLHSILRDPARNLLHNYFGLKEEEGLQLQPDCADLPYFLRAYFAWKMRLPFGYRSCTRGRGGKAPTCGAVQSNEDVLRHPDEGKVVRAFFRSVKQAAHSASARTLPKDEESDLYPLPLERQALRPGTVYADPYGHLLILTRWIPQKGNQSGILMAAEAQPDGTIGRKRFWRGSFLFRPETREAGAGFKAWRPLVQQGEGGGFRVLKNAQLRKESPYPPYSEQQYAGTVDDFYDRMEALINPRPMSPQAVLQARIEALAEMVRWRLISVDNGENYTSKHRGPPIAMPKGYAVFETSGAWEDFATPSRDMRLLIGLDTVMGLADEVRRDPKRFALAGKDPQASAQELSKELPRVLAQKSFKYRRSDGKEQSFSLQDLWERRRAFEVAYNPNDCIEVRWGAPEGSEEMRSCKRRAPADQRARMDEYRAWFRERKRPSR
mgnify:CR=1 FL=1